MSETLAIQWDDGRLILLQGKASGGSVSARHALILDWPEELDPVASPKPSAEWLKGELTRHGLGARQAIVSLPRESVMVKDLELPGVPDDELPDIVRLQAATQVTLAPDQFLLDYVPLPPTGAESRDVLLTTVPTSVLDLIRTVLTGAGLELGSVSVSSFLLTELVLQQQDARSRAAQLLHLVISPAGDRYEVVLFRGNCTLAASSVRIEGDSADVHRAVNAEVNRLRMLTEKLHGGLPISEVWITTTGAKADALLKFLTDKLHSEGHSFDALTGADEVSESDRGQFAPLAGFLCAEAGEISETIDFLAPRKAVVKRDTRKLRMALAAAGAVAVLGTAWWMFRSRLDQRAQQIAAVTEKATKIQAAVDLGADDVAAAALVDDWQSRSMDWLQQMRALNGILPGGDLVLVQKLSFRPGRGDTRASIRIEGYARSRTEVEDLGDLLQKRGYQVVPPTIESSSRDQDYASFFAIDATVPLPKKEKA